MNPGLASMFKAYDVRGLVASELTPAVVEAIGAAAVDVLGHEGPASQVAIGHDMRPSSPQLAQAFAAGVMSRGCDVVEVGLASTDMLYYVSGILDIPGAMFTASHNPPEYNGIKLCRAGASPVSIDSGLGKIRDVIAAAGPADALRASAGTSRKVDMLEDFADHVRSFVDGSSLGDVRVVVDAGNGMGGLVVPAVFDPLPVEIVPLFFELDGTFPNHPANPIEPENLVDLQRAVIEHQALLGLAFDGDADRVFAVDEAGSLVSSSLIGAVVADHLLRGRPGETVLYNLICSRIVPETVIAAGGEARRTRVGHSFIKQTMAETGAIFACEHSGHYYFRDNFRADSGLIAALVLLAAVAEAGEPLSQVVAPYAKYHQSGEVNFTVNDQQTTMDFVAEVYAGQGSHDWEDGLTIDLGERWFNVRASNTEPLLRLNVEAGTEESMVELRDQVAALLSS